MALISENDLKDPGYFKENTIPAHADIKYYRNEEEAEAENSSYRISLNGLWKFRWFKNLREACPDFYETDFDCRCWDDIEVPSCIEMAGYGQIQYVNTQYPWDGREMVSPGDIPHEYNPVGEYVKYFKVPAELSGMPVCIRFDGVESGFALYLNGNYVGYSEGSFTPSEFDLTEYIDQKGENKLAVAVFRFTSGSWLEDQDFFRFSGIFRNVTLFTVPEVHVQDILIKTDLDQKYKDAVLNISLQLSKSGKIGYELVSPDGTTVFSKKKKAGKDSILSEIIEDPVKWSAEKPGLYTLILKVYDEKDCLQEVVVQKVGFRKFEIKRHQMMLNGKRIVFRGVNRHEFSDIKARAIGYEETLQDLITMKRNNINAVRTCHYPNQEVLYDLCDRLGLYVLDETNLETHGTWDPIARGIMPVEYAVPGDREEYLENVLDRGYSMYMKDKNHPSVLIWSLGNESYGGTVLKKLHDAFHGWDDTRPVHYEGVINDMRYPETTDMVSTMYWRVDQIKDYLKENRNKPFINCEYTHAMGNSCGGMELYTELADTEPLFQGGFIWDYIDQAIRTKDRYGKDYEGYGGDFHDRPHDGNFSGDGIAFARDRKPTPKMQDVKYNYRPVKISGTETGITFENRNLFTDVSEYGCTIKVERNGFETERYETSFEVKPLSKKTFGWPMDLPDGEDAEYCITVSLVLTKDTSYAKAGHEVAWGQYVYGKMNEVVHPKEKIKVVKGMNGVGIYGEGFSAMFSRLQGGLISYVYGGKEMIEKMPRPNFWRAMTDNDMGDLQFTRSAQWKTASEFTNSKYYDGIFVKDIPFELKEHTDSADVTFRYILCTIPEIEVALRYTVHSDGWVDVYMTMPKSKAVGELPEYSLMFTMGAQYENLSWYGLGPEETYQDRRCGKLGCYDGKVREMMAPYLRPQESGNHTGVRVATVTDELGHGLIFKGDELSFSALPYKPSEIENADHHFDLPEIHYTYVRAGYSQMGVSGDDTWGARTLPQFMIDNSKALKLKFSFKGI